MATGATTTQSSLPAGYTASDLVFNDDFSGTTLDKDWHTYITSNAAKGAAWNSNGSGGSSMGSSYNADYDLGSNVSVNNGLTLTDQKQSTTVNGQNFSYTSGAVTSYGNFEFTGGYLQITAQDPGGSGAWPALWLLPGQSAGNSGDNFEIDMQEGGLTTASNPNDYMSYHLHNSQGQFGGSVNTGTDLTQGYHTYGIDWVPGKSITWYLDGKEIGEVTSAQTTIPDEPMEVIMSNSLASSGASGFRSTVNSSTPTTNQMKISSVQLYQQPGSGDTVLGSNVTASSGGNSSGTTTGTGTGTTGSGSSTGTTTGTGASSGSGGVTNPTGGTTGSGTSASGGSSSTGSTTGTGTGTSSGSGSVTDPTGGTTGSGTSASGGSSSTGGTTGAGTSSGSGSVTDPSGGTTGSGASASGGSSSTGSTTGTGTGTSSGTGSVTDPSGGTTGSGASTSTGGHHHHHWGSGTTGTGTSSSGSTTTVGTGAAGGTTTPTAPAVTVADPSLSVSPGQGVDLGVSVKVPTAGDNVTVNIKGLPSYETITDKLDGKTFSGSNVTLSAAQVNSGLTLNSSYEGKGHPTSTLMVTATDQTSNSSSAAQSIAVTDPASTSTTATSGSGSTGSGSTASSGTSSHGGHQWGGGHHSDVSQWFDNHPGFAKTAKTLSDAFSSNSSASSAAGSSTNHTASAGDKAYALFNQMMAGDFGNTSHFTQGGSSSAQNHQQTSNLLTRPLH